MKNVQVIDGADNSVYDIFEFDDALFARIFGSGRNVAFIEDFLVEGGDRPDVHEGFNQAWRRPVAKSAANGIDGTLFYEMLHKKVFYPDRVDEHAQSEEGRPLRPCWYESLTVAELARRSRDERNRR